MERWRLIKAAPALFQTPSPAPGEPLGDEVD